MVPFQRARGEQQHGIRDRQRPQATNLTVSHCEKFAACGQLVVVNVVHLSDCVRLMRSDDQGIRAIVDVRERQPVASTESEKQSGKLKPQARRKSRGMGTVDDSGTQDHEGIIVFAPGFPKQLLLAQLDLRIRVPTFGMTFQWRSLVNHGSASQRGHLVDSEARHQNHFRWLRSRQYRREEVLRGHHRVQSHIRGSSTERRGQVVHDRGAIDGTRRFGGRGERARPNLEPAIGVPSPQRVESSAVASRPHECDQPGLPLLQETLDQSCPQEAVRSRDHHTHLAPPSGSRARPASSVRACRAKSSCFQIVSSITDMRIKSR